jgi:pyruvate dehydrogenase E1 component alpha subunit
MKSYPRDMLVDLLTMMIRIRFCEESLVPAILEGEIRTPCHLYSGEEAIATGVCACLQQSDYIFGTHRSHGHFLAKGGSMNSLVAEILGRKEGCSLGRGGSMHVIDPDLGISGGAPIVAGTVPLAVGAALASKIRKDKRVTVAFFGDGATGEGVLYESLNFAGLKKLPLVFVCENNFYSTHMPIRECRPDIPIFEIAKPFGITSSSVDGNNILEVYEAANEAVGLCRGEKGPVFMECLTYRLRGHVGPDDNIQGSHTDIRPKEELEKWKMKDPIVTFEKYLLKNRIMEKEEIEERKKQVEKEVEEALEFARKSPYPKESELSKYVFKESR